MSYSSDVMSARFSVFIESAIAGLVGAGAGFIIAKLAKLLFSVEFDEYKWWYPAWILAGFLAPRFLIVILKH